MRILKSIRTITVKTMRKVNLQPQTIKEAEEAMSNAYYNWYENKDHSKHYELCKIWSDLSDIYKQFKKKLKP